VPGVLLGLWIGNAREFVAAGGKAAIDFHRLAQYCGASRATAVAISLRSLRLGASPTARSHEIRPDQRNIEKRKRFPQPSTQQLQESRDQPPISHLGPEGAFFGFGRIPGFARKSRGAFERWGLALALRRGTAAGERKSAALFHGYQEPPEET